jgi:predicted transcriptional regulator
MTMAAEHSPQQPRYSVRRQARPDGDTHAKRKELAKTFQRKRGAILCDVIQWGLTTTTGWIIDSSIPDRSHPVHLLVNPELLQQVQDAAESRGVTVAAWLRQAMRQVTPDDFPPSWRAGDIATGSHDSGYYYRKFQLRLDDDTARKLETLTQTFHRPAAEIIRQLIAEAAPENFPQSWHLAVQERRPESSRGEREGSSTRVPREDHR